MLILLLLEKKNDGEVSIETMAQKDDVRTMKTDFEESLDLVEENYVAVKIETDEWQENTNVDNKVYEKGTDDFASVESD